MVDQEALADFQRSTRMPLDAVVRLHFEGTVAYQNGFAANVSASGMYVKHPDPPPVGTRLVFEFSIGAQRRPVQGAGEVVWSRDKYDGPGRPAGAGIRFVELDPLSRQHLTEALFEFLEASLGDRVVENPEARALVASVPTHAPPESYAAEPEAAPEPAPAPAAAPEPRSPPPPATLHAPLLPAIEEATGAPTPFRIYDEEPAPFVPASAPPPAAVPETAWGEDTHSVYGAAVARPAEPDRRPAWIAGGVVLAAAAALAAWWFFWRAPAPPAPSAPAPAAARPAAAPARPAPPPLDARVGAGRTLVESVGGAVKAPETPLPPAGPGPGESTEPDAEAPAGSPEPATAPSTAPPPAAAPAPAPAAALVAPAPVARAPEPVPALRAATDLRGISAAAAAGTTVVTIAADGAFATGSFSWSEMGGDKPRVLVRLKGIGAGFRGGASGVPTPELAGIRSGYHAEAGRGELHIVLDLVPGARVAVESVEPAADRLLITLRRR